MDERLLFHLTGKRTGSLGAVDGLRPALFARTDDLTTLRYDFPIVLVDGVEGAAARALSAIFDELIAEVAPKGLAGDRLRRQLIRLEREIRVLAAQGFGGTLASLWSAAAARIAPLLDEGSATADLDRACTALRAGGEVVDCGAEAPARLVGHAWRATLARRAVPVRRTIDELVLRLGDLVRADLMRSAEGRRAGALRDRVGGDHRDLFDFDLMAHLIAPPSGPSQLPGRRRRRIEGALAILRGERFFAERDAYRYTFDRVDVALAAYRERLPRFARLVRAIAIGELEVEGRYVDADHDAYFAALDVRALGPRELALFPGSLVRLAAAGAGPSRPAEVLDALTSGGPLKILLEIDDVYAPEARLATAAMGQGGVFVVQCPSSHLLAAAPALAAALEHPGPALISVFTGAGRGVPPYLVAAAALESRAFPAFAYDPAPADGAPSLSLIAAPQPERTWAVHELAYADEAMQRVSERVAFTPADLALLDASHAGHFAQVPRESWDARLVPVAERLEGGAPPGAIPFVYAADAKGLLHKLIVDERATEAADRLAEAWLRLRELALPAEGVTAPAPVEVPPVPAAASNGGSSAAVEAAPAFAADREPAADEAYIETPRCTSCNECTLINPRMFAYNEDKQAYIKDPLAGSYRELVEAAESCQVAIIHPGSPRDPSEEGIEELVERAAAFR